jgi:hypothetical protein
MKATPPHVMFKWWQKTKPETITPPIEFVIDEPDQNYKLISSATEVQVRDKVTNQPLSIHELPGHHETTQRNAQKLYSTLCDVYMCDPPSEPGDPPQKNTPSHRMARIPYLFKVEYRSNTEDRDEERLEVYITARCFYMRFYLQDNDKLSFQMRLYFCSPALRKYTPVTLDAMGYSLSISRKKATIPGWAFKSATYDINPKERAGVTTMYDMDHNEIGTLTTDTNIILDKIFFAERISELTASLIDNGQTLRIEVDIAYSDYQAVLLFTRNPQTLATASAQRLLEGIERVLNA